MRRDHHNQSDYYREQASRVRKRADLANTQEARESLLDFALRWERLATGAAPDTTLPITIMEQTMNDAIEQNEQHEPSEQEVRKLAEKTIKTYQANAAVQASQRARQALDTGDVTGFELWTRVAKMILEIGRKTSRGQQLH